MRIILNGSVGTVKRLRISLGTLVAIEATAGSTTAAEAAVEAAFAAVVQVDHCMHPQAADSDLAIVNSAPLNTPVTVHSSICYLLTLALRLNTFTAGVFDPCLPMRPGRLPDIEVANNSVICHAPVSLDFGGFAKGYAVDRAIDVLMNSGCTRGLVNAGGDMRVFGPRPEATFLRGPTGELNSVELTDAALAVSDANSQQRPAEHQGYYVRKHAVSDYDNRADLIPLAAQYAAVIAREAVVADALAKCVLLCPKPVADRVLRSFNAIRLQAPALAHQ